MKVCAYYCKQGVPFMCDGNRHGCDLSPCRGVEKEVRYDEVAKAKRKREEEYENEKIQNRNRQKSAV